MKEGCKLCQKFSLLMSILVNSKLQFLCKFRTTDDLQIILFICEEILVLWRHMCLCILLKVFRFLSHVQCTLIKILKLYKNYILVYGWILSQVLYPCQGLIFNSDFFKYDLLICVIGLCIVLISPKTFFKYFFLFKWMIDHLQVASKQYNVEIPQVMFFHVFFYFN